MTNDHSPNAAHYYAYQMPTDEEVRNNPIGRFLREELREAVLDGLLESAKPHATAGATGRYIQKAIAWRLEGLLDERENMGVDWAGILLAGHGASTYETLFGSPTASKATHDALVGALRRTISEYVDG